MRETKDKKPEISKIPIKITDIINKAPFSPGNYDKDSETKETEAEEFFKKNLASPRKKRSLYGASQEPFDPSGLKILLKKEINEKKIQQQTRTADNGGAAISREIKEIPGLSAKLFGSAKKLFFIFLASIFFIIGGLLFFFLPKAEIEIIPAHRDLSFNLDLEADQALRQIDFGSSQIPAQLIKTEREESDQFSVSEERDLEEKAKGVIIVYNEFSPEATTLVETTRFSSPEGKIFRTLEKVTVPGLKVEAGKVIPGEKEVAVIADKAGEDYNIGFANFTIPAFKEYGRLDKYQKIYGKLKSPMVGGIVGRVKAVSAKDLEEAERTLKERLFTKVKRELETQLPEEIYFLEETLEGEVANLDAPEKETVADKFTMRLKMNFELLTFKKNQVEEVVNRNLEAKVSRDEEILAGSENIEYSDFQFSPESKTLTFRIKFSGKAMAKIDIEKLKENLIGKKEEEVESYLRNLSQIESAQITLWPFWARRVSSSPQKVNIELILDSLD